MHHAHPCPAPRRDPAPRPRRAAVWLVASLVALAAALLGGGPASAHAELESSSPVSGAILTAPPDTLTFTFGEDLLDTGDAITLTGPGGDRLSLAEPTVDGPTISVPWPVSAPSGEFTAAFRVVSADGHPVKGAITFTVLPATPPSGTSADPGVVLPGAGASPTAISASPQAPTSAPAAPPGGAGPESQPEAGVLAWVLGVGVVALVGALAATWVTRRTRSG